MTRALITALLLLSACQSDLPEEEVTTDVGECFFGDPEPPCSDDVCREEPLDGQRLNIALIFPSQSRCDHPTPFAASGNTRRSGWSVAYLARTTLQTEDDSCVIRVNLEIRIPDEPQEQVQPPKLRICEPIFASGAAYTLEEVWGTLEQFSIQSETMLSTPQSLALVRSTSSTDLRPGDLDCLPTAYPRSEETVIETELRIPIETWQLLELHAGESPVLFGLVVPVVASD